MPNRSFIACLLSAWIFSSSPAYADYKLPVPPPASAANKAIRIEVGAKTQILLEARGNGGREATFVLREPPRRGKLSQLKKIAPGQAVVTYTHSSRKGEGTDQFRYAVQLSGGPVSAAGTVTIEAVESRPRVEFPLLVDFGRIMLGDAPEEQIDIYNSGGGNLQGILTCPAPFSVTGDTQAFSLGPRSGASFHIKFSPSAPGEFSVFANLMTEGGGQIQLQGSCFAPFAAVPETVHIAADAEGIRAARLKVQSSSEEALSCKLTYEGGLQGPAEIQIAPQDVAEFDTWATAENPEGRPGKISLSHGSFTLGIPVEIDPIGPRLHWSNTSAEIPVKGREASGEIWIQNDGGKSGLALVDAPNLTLDPVGPIDIPAGQRRSLKVKWTEAEGSSSTKLITLNGSPMTLHATFSKSGVPNTGNQVIPNLSEETSQESYASSSSAGSITKLDVIRQSEREIFLKWTNPSGAVKYTLEMLVFDKKQALPAWKTVTPDAVRTEGKETVMELKGLYPGAAYSFRIRSVDSLGNAAAPSPELRLSTLVPKPFRLPWIGILVVLMLGGGGWLFYLRWLRPY